MALFCTTITSAGKEPELVYKKQRGFIQRNEIAFPNLHSSSPHAFPMRKYLKTPDRQQAAVHILGGLPYRECTAF
jgi:hypothetical protein